ncbi:hypothetical protein JCM6882_007160 [Rhodosporidiobolus microsporus]
MASLNLDGLDPLTSPSRDADGLLADESFFAPPTPFGTSLRPSSSATFDAEAPSFPSAAQPESSLLIDFAPTPRSSSSTKPLRLSSSTRKSLAVPSASSSVRKPSPLKFSFFEDSFDESTAGGALPAPLAFSGSSSALHRVEEDTENVPSLGRAKGKKWGAMSRMREEKSRRRSRSLSPVKDWSPVKEGNSSMAISAHHLEAGDLSLIADEGGSFLLNGGNSGDVTLEALPQIGEEPEDDAAGEGSGGMSQLLRGLGESTIARPNARRPLSKMPTSQSVPALSSILPPNLIASSRPPLSRSLSRSVSLAAAGLPPVPPLNAEVEPPHNLTPEPSLLQPNTSALAGEESLLAATAEPSFLVPGFRSASLAEPSFFAFDTTRALGEDLDGDTGGAGEMSFLNASTASFKEYRDSPVKPRVVSIQAERWDEEGTAGKTPRPMGRMGRVSDASSSGGSGADDGTSGSSFDFAGCKTGDFSTLFHQLPPAAALKPESTATLLIGLQSPIRPTAASIFASSSSSTATASPLESQRDLLACSTRTIVPEAESPLETPTPSSPVHASLFSPLPTSAPAASTAFAVPEGDLLGIGNVAPSPPRASAVEPAQAQKAQSGADRLKRRLEELRAQKQKGEEATVPASTATTTPRQRRTTPPSREGDEVDTPAARHPFAESRPSTVVKPQKTLKPSRSSIALAGGAGASKPAPLGRLARPRGSTLPTSSSTSSLASVASSARPRTPPPARSSSAQPEGSKTPGERKESTRARLERLREERKEREAGRMGAPSPEKKSVAPAAAGLVRRKSIAAPGLGAASSARTGARQSLAPPTRAAPGAGVAGAAKPASGLARPSLVRPSSTTTSSSSSAAPTRASARPSLAPAAGRPSLARPSSIAASSSSAALKRPSAAAPPPTKLQFSSMPPPRARAPLKGIQPPSSTAGAATGASGSSSSWAKAASSAAGALPKPTLKPRASMIGLGRPSAAGAGRK